MRKLLLVVALVSCTADPPMPVPSDGGEERRTFAAASEGGLALADSGGAILARWSAGRVDDLVTHDGTVFTFEGGDDEGGTVRARSIGERGSRRLAFVDGRATLFPTRFGVVLFEESDGMRWKLMGAMAPSVPAPVPSSLLRVGEETFAFGREVDDSWSVRTLRVDAHGVSSSVAPLSERFAPSARMVATPSGLVAIDVRAGHLRVGSTELPVDLGAVADARAMGEAIVVVTAEPARLVVAQGNVHDAVMLEGSIDPRPLGRSLVVLDEQRVIAATDRSVSAARVVRDGRVPHIVVEWRSHDLHAPIDGPL